jgi:hypothetical protein
MMEPVIRAVVDQDAFALIATASIEWKRFESRGLAQVKAEFDRWVQRNMSACTSTISRDR